MASSPVPTTPEHAPRRIAINRSFTAPIKTSPSTKAQPEIGATEGVETLFVHPSASIIKFTTPSSRPSSSSPRRGPSSSQGTLPWTSLTERTVAAGPMQIYRVPGSVSFLKSGTLLHAVLPKTQCWCVDGISKFALRVLPDTYYRVELPGETEEDKEEVEKLKITLQKVCYYERTPCPFARGFDVELPDEQEITPRKKRRKSLGPAKKWKLDGKHSWKPEGWKPLTRKDDEDESSGVGSSPGSEDESEPSSGREDSGSDDKVSEVADKVKDLKVTTPSRVRTARTMLEQRSVTSPAQFSLQSPPPSRLRTREDADGTIEVAEQAAEGAAVQDTGRLRTFQAIPTDMPPSPPDSSAGLDHAETLTLGEAVTAEQTNVDSETVVSQVALDEEEAQIVEGAEDEDESVLICHNDEEKDLPEDSDQQPTSIDISDDYEPPQTPVIANAERTTQIADREKDSISPQQHMQISEAASIPQTELNDPFAAPILEPAAAAPSTKSTSPPAPTAPEDPFAAIQARILARRSIGGTTSFHPPPSAHSTSSASSASSSLSHASHARSTDQQRTLATAMVKKACSAFLGPPAHLIALMLRIAARFAKGAFGVDSMFYVESPEGSQGRIPGSFVVREDEEEGESELDEWEEDDFGVPLRSPVRLAAVRRRESAVAGGKGRGWDVD